MSFPRYPEYKDSGVEWLREVPGHWDVRPLKHLARLQTGMTPPTDEWDNYTEEEGFQWVRPEDLDETGTPTKSSKFLTNKGWMQTRRIKAGASLICCIGTIGKVGVTTDPVSTNQQITAAEPRQDSRYLFYAICAGRTELELASTGNVLRILNTERLGNVSCPNPPLPEQIQIATFLDRETAKIDALVSEQRRLMALLKEKRQAVISHAVTRGLNPLAPLKPSGIEWLGDVPEHWGIGQSRRLFAFRNERALDTDKQLTASQVHGVIYQDDFIRLEGRRVVEVIKGADILKHVEPNDFVISMRSFQGGIEWCQVRGCISSAYVMLTPCDRIHAPFFQYVLKSQSYIQALQTTSNLVRDGQALRYDNFTQVDLPLVPLHEQTEIAAFLDTELAKFDTLTTEAQRAIALLAERRTALISAAVTGQIDVRAGVQLL